MNYHKHILEGLREWSRIIVQRDREAKVDMLYHFITLMGEEHFNRAFEERFMGDLEFDEGYFEFHKSMRQVDFFDVTDNGHVDMLFWNFLHVTEIPYKVFKVFTEKMKIGVIGDMDDIDNLNAKTNGWNKFGFFQIKRK